MENNSNNQCFILKARSARWGIDLGPAANWCGLSRQEIDCIATGICVGLSHKYKRVSVTIYDLHMKKLGVRYN